MDCIRSTCFVSSALPYVNAAPHLGFALELVIADVVARSRRSRGDDVCLVSGTDDHSLKNVTSAERAGVAVHDFVSRNAERFRALGQALDVSIDAFVRTSADPLHAPNVREIWQRLERGGDLYLRDYRGLYCVGCERFCDADELVDGQCAEHPGALELSAERNWFFRLSRYRERLVRVLEENHVRIEPESARREALQFLRGEVRDLSVSRDAERARGFGILVPADPTQVVYVWVDALFGYLTALGSARERYWTQANERVHVIGKGITRFHAVYWLALLLASDLPLPTQILIHGYLTVDGQKISKSGISLDPLPIIAEYGAEALRYYLLRHVKTTRDGDFSLTRLAQAHDAELSNQLGNLVSRVLALVERFAASKVPELTHAQPADRALLDACATLSKQVGEAIDAFQLDRGLDLIFERIECANRYVDEQAPWSLAKSGPSARLGAVLATLCQGLLAIAQALAPYLPRTSGAILAGLGSDPHAKHCTGNRVVRPPALFPRRALRVSR